MWKPRKTKIALNSPEYFFTAAQQHEKLQQKLHMQALQQQHSRRESVSTNASHSTLAEEIEIPKHHVVEEIDMDLKTPTAGRMSMKGEADGEENTSTKSHDADEFNLATKQSLPPAGPMERLLHSLLRKVTDVERGAPTVMAEEYEKLNQRLQALEKEKMAFIEAHAALLTIRNDDLCNLIKVRGLLAEERREHAAIRKLRDEDLENVLVLREKLAHATWSKPQQHPAPQQQRRSSGSRSPTPRQSRSVGDDLWQQARTAAMEQRVLELERANSELRAQKEPVGAGDVLRRVESMFDDSLKHREKMASRVQQLRSEKEALQREVSVLEDRNTELEALVERLQRDTSL